MSYLFSGQWLSSYLWYWNVGWRRHRQHCKLRRVFVGRQTSGCFMSETGENTKTELFWQTIVVETFYIIVITILNESLLQWQLLLSGRLQIASVTCLLHDLYLGEFWSLYLSSYIQLRVVRQLVVVKSKCSSFMFILAPMALVHLHQSHLRCMSAHTFSSSHLQCSLPLRFTHFWLYSAAADVIAALLCRCCYNVTAAMTYDVIVAMTSFPSPVVHCALYISIDFDAHENNSFCSTVSL